MNIGDIINFGTGDSRYLIVDTCPSSLGTLEILDILDYSMYTVHNADRRSIPVHVAMSSPKIYTGPLTQEEIDEIIESYNNSVPGIIPQNTGVGSPSNVSFEYADEDNLVIGDGWHEYNEGWYNDSPPACRHKWKKYVGLSQSFEYCEICDKKKGEV